MAKRQTRRTFSVSRACYEAAKLEAERRGVSAAHFCELALQAYGVEFSLGEAQPPAIVALAVAGKVEAAALNSEQRAQRRRTRERKRSQQRYQARPSESYVLRDGPIRKALGDVIADQLGEPRWKQRVT